MNSPAADLMARLSSARGPVSGAALAASLGMSRAAVHKRIEKLRAQGHRIVGVNRLGYRLEGAADLLDDGSFAPGWGKPFHHFESVGSTQDEAKKAALDGAPEGAFFVAERQTAGRGRMGRRWESPPGGLWFSLVLRPPMPPGRAAALALVAALDWARVMAEVGVAARVKWPNDVWVGERKVAGLLTEMSSEADRVHWIVLGAGVNVNNDPPAGTAVPAASLKSLLGRSLRRRDLLAAWMSRFRKSFRLYQREGFAPFREGYAGVSLLHGRRVSFDGGAGTATGVDGEGRLLVATRAGPVVLVGGEVSLKISR